MKRTLRTRMSLWLSGGADGGATKPLPMALLRSIAVKFGIYGVNAATGIITARILNPAGRGELAAMIVWPTLIAGVTTLGVPAALIYRVRTTPERISALVGAALSIATISGILGTLIGWFLVPLWLRDQHADIVRAAQLCLLATTISSVAMVARAGFESLGNFDRSNLVQLLVPLTTVAALLPLALFGRLTPQTAAAVYILAAVPSTVWALASLARKTIRTTARTGREWGELLHFGARSYGIDLCGVLAIYLDQALVVGLLKPEAMGHYVVALSLSRVINAIQGSVALMAFPRMVGLEPRELGRSVARAARLSALVSGAVGLVVILLGGTLITFLYGDSFASAGRILPILVAEVVLAGVAQVLLQGFLASGRPGVGTMVQILGLGLSVPVFLLLVPTLGEAGAAIGLLISTTLRVAFTIAAYPAFLRLPMPRIWIARSDLDDLVTYRAALLQAVGRLRPTP